VDETYVTVAGRRRSVDRAIDQFGQVIDLVVSASLMGGLPAASSNRAIGPTQVPPVEVVTDRAPRYPVVLGRSCCRRPGIAPTGMATTVSKPIMAG
jgi:transposase-like protein